MPIYDQPIRMLLQEYAKDHITPGQVFSRNQPLEWFAKHYPKIKPVSDKMHVEGMATNSTQRKHHPHIRAGLGWDLFYKLPSGQYRLWDPNTDPAPLYKSSIDLVEKQQGAPSNVEEDEEDISSSEPSTFAYEHHLRDFLARNLSAVESGLKLYEEEGFSGVEFPVGGRFIDVLATDPAGNFVVIELKVSRGYDRTIGQILRYMGWIEKNLAGSKNVRGVIVANEISEDLRLAASRIKDVRLMEYEMLFKLKGVSL